jgi:hypothetical protein
VTGLPPDPRFPDRPTHEDFARLSEVVIEQDDNMKVDDVIDLESLMYMAINRVEMARQRGALGVPSWIDGFMAGARYAQRVSRETS